MRFTYLTVTLFCVLLIYGFPNQSAAQRTIGVNWNVTENRQTAIDQLDSLLQLDISYLRINKQPSDTLWEKIRLSDFTVFGELPISFPLANDFADADSSLLKTINSNLDRYGSRESVGAIGLFKYGAVYDTAIDTSIRPLLKQIRSEYGGNLYYITSRSKEASIDSLFDFKILEPRISAYSDDFISDSLSGDLGGFIYRPEKEGITSLKLFKSFLLQVSGYSVPVFVDAEWVFKMIEENPGFETTLQLYNSNSEFVFPTPKEQPESTRNHSLIVLLLVLIWGVFAVNYHMSPVYRKSLSRYFLGHTFFVEDVMDRHIRSVSPVITIIIQNVLLAGICSYGLAYSLLSPLGLEALRYHYPFISIFKNPVVSFFIWGCLLGALLTLISIIWIKISYKQIIRFRQVLNLYAWPLQINFIIATLVVTLLMAGNYPIAIFLLVSIFWLVLISAFIATAADASQYLISRTFLRLTVNIGLYCLLWIGLAFWVLNTSLPEVIRLALSL